MTEEDELALVRQLAHWTFEVYPRRVPPDWQPFQISEKAFEALPKEEMYLAASDIGPPLVDLVKRGPDKGSLRIDEVQSPVLYWERCQRNDAGELLSGQLWSELTGQPAQGKQWSAPDPFQRRIREIESWIRSTFRKSAPKGFWIGPRLAREMKSQSITLRESVHRGSVVALASR